MALFLEDSKKDLSFLEPEFLTYLLANFFINDNSVRINETNYYYIPVKNIVLSNKENSENIKIQTDTFDTCRELYTALKSEKVVTLLQVNLKNENLCLDFCIKTQPLRITKVNAPKSLAEEYSEKVIERKLYLDTVYAFYDNMIKDFVNLRVSNTWHDFLIKFRDFLTSS